MENLEKIIDELNKLKTTLDCEDVIITGSFVLNLNGLTDKEPGDIDVLVLKPTENCKVQIKTLQDMNPAATKPLASSSLNLLGIAKLNGIKFDFFEQKDRIKALEYRGFKITTVRHIIDAKLQSNREKDLVHLLKMSESIMTEQVMLQRMKNKFI